MKSLSDISRILFSKRHAVQFFLEKVIGWLLFSYSMNYCSVTIEYSIRMKLSELMYNSYKLY